MKNNENWKITIEQYGCKYSLELDHADVTLEEVYNALRQIMLCSGWSEEQLKEIFNEV